MESAATPRFKYHAAGLTFTGDPSLLGGAKNAGIDFLSLANNHIGNAGKQGILDSIAAVDAQGIAHSGAGHTLAEALKPATFTVKGTKVAIIGCDSISPGTWAKADTVGSNPCDSTTLVPAIRDAKLTNDIVIIYPHWGTEYRASVSNAQRRAAKNWIDAGADLIIGNHVHWAAAMEDIGGKIVFYAMGNFVFDQEWSEQTMEGMLGELTFQGKTLMQVRLRPTLIVDNSQPNFLDPTKADQGGIVLKQMRDASRRTLPY
jgi:poly-gamma-glutamate synthesis protein (capsule biosynthesis protein)